MTVLIVEYFNKIKDCIHPNLQKIVKDYKDENVITLPPFHSCGYGTKNGTRNLMDYARRYWCVTPSWRNYWKKDVKAKYQHKTGNFYVTRYLTPTKFA